MMKRKTRYPERLALAFRRNRQIALDCALINAVRHRPPREVIAMMDGWTPRWRKQGRFLLSLMARRES